MDITNKHTKDLFELLSIPSISAQSEHKKDIASAAKWLSQKLTKLGFNAKVMSTKGHPVVFAERITNHKSPITVLIYGHYDVQSPDPLDEWKSDPFKPEIRNGNIYCRGVADDKGQLFTWIAAIQEIIDMQGTFPCNIKFLIEGEEEVGSKNLDDFVRQNKKLLKADICVISDTHCFSEKIPMINRGLRGLVYFDVKVKAFPKDVHSGVYGGNVANPANILATMIAKLKDENHKVTIPEFYENVRKLSVKEKRDLLKLPFTKKQIKDETGAIELVGENEFGIHARAGARPTLDVNGIWSGYTGEGPKTIIPSSAFAKISMRLVPNQTAKEIEKKFTKFFKSLTPTGVIVQVKMISSGEPIIVDTNSKYFQKAEIAYKRVFGIKPIYELSGGSIPVTATFKNILKIDSVLMGYGLPDDGLHSPNEKFSLNMFKKGIKTNIEFIKSLAD